MQCLIAVKIKKLGFEENQHRDGLDHIIFEYYPLQSFLFVLVLSLPCLLCCCSHRPRKTGSAHIYSSAKMDHINKVKDTYDRLWELRDTRVDHLPLTGSFVPVIIIALIYVYIVKVWGPRHMKEKAPYQLRQYSLQSKISVHI